MLSEDVLTRLQSQGVGTPGTDLFKSTMPPKPDVCLVVREVGGGPPTRMMGRVACENPEFQVFARATTYDAARDLIWKVFNALDNFSGSINSNRYLWISANQSPSYVTQDENNRFVMHVSFRVQKELTPVS